MQCPEFLRYLQKEKNGMADTRVQFDFTEAALNELDALKEELGVKTRAEVVRYALRLMQWLIQQITNGGRILVERKNGEVQSVVFPFLGKVAETKAQKEEATRPLVAVG